MQLTISLEVMLASPYVEGFADLPIDVIYDSRDPLAVRLRFDEHTEWVFALELLRQAARGLSCGHGDIVFSPNLDIPGCMNLFMTNGNEDATVVFSRSDLGRISDGIPERDITGEKVMRNELDKFLSGILED